jgi:hypothetical protein
MPQHSVPGMAAAGGSIHKPSRTGVSIPVRTFRVPVDGEHACRWQVRSESIASRDG